MKEILDNIRAIVDTYYGLPDKLTFNEAEILQGLMKNLSSNLFYLEAHRDREARMYYSTINTLKGEGDSATAAEKEAKYQHPEKRMLDRVIHGAQKVLDAMRSNQSFLKKEQ